MNIHVDILSYFTHTCNIKLNIKKMVIIFHF